MKDETRKTLKDITGGRGAVFALICALSVLQSALTVALALAIKHLVNAAKYGAGLKGVLSAAAIAVAVIVSSFLTGVLNRLLSSACVTRIETALKRYAVKGYVKSAYSKMSGFGGGDVISRVETDAQRVASVYTGLVPSLLSTGVTLVGTVAVMAFLQPVFTLIVSGLGALVVLITYIVRKKSASMHKTRRKHESELYSFVGETAANALFIKTSGTEEKIYDTTCRKLLVAEKSRLNQRLFSSVVSSFTGLLFTGFYCVTMVFGVYGIVSGRYGVDFGVLIAMLELVNGIRSPMASISGYLPAYQEMKVSLARLSDLCGENNERTVNGDCGFEKIELKNVSFSYGGADVIENADLTVNRGDKILLKGESGTGKSTLIKLLTGVETAESGSVFVYLNGNGFSPARIKNLFAFVPQGNMLFSGSLRENLTFLNPDATDGEIEKAVKAADLYSAIESLGGIDGVIGEGGCNLSEGQAQRVAIARALLSDYPVLIFDEPTSALDGDTENKVIAALNDYNDKTMIIVSHKPAAEKFCNRTIVMQELNISEK